MRLPVPEARSTRWAEAVGALEEVFAGPDGGLPVGLKLFPSADRLCEVAEGVELDVSLAAREGLLGRIRGSPPPPLGPSPSGSPLHEAVRAATARARQTRGRVPRFLLLATDGRPSCPDGERGAEESLLAVREAHQAGLRTFVLGVGAPSDGPQHRLLSELAVAGGEPAPGATRHLAAATRPQLRAALERITGQLSGCVFMLDVSPPAPDNVALFLAGRRLLHDRQQAEGWSYGAGGALVVQLYGSACDAARTTAAPELEMILGCPEAPVP
jgi:hypothetical protein